MRTKPGTTVTEDLPAVCMGCGLFGKLDGDDATLERVTQDGLQLVRCVHPAACMQRSKNAGNYCVY